MQKRKVREPVYFLGRFAEADTGLFKVNAGGILLRWSRQDGWNVTDDSPILAPVKEPRAIQLARRICERQGEALTYAEACLLVLGREPLRRGFALMSSDQQRKISGRGGKISQEKNNGHVWSPEQARVLASQGGKKGGSSRAQKIAQSRRQS